MKLKKDNKEEKKNSDKKSSADKENFSVDLGITPEESNVERTPVDIPAVGYNLDFPVKEAINLLRTNLSLSFADAEAARSIGITSSVRGEGKSFVSVNLAYSLSEMNYKVLLLEGDLRLPTIAAKLNIRKAPGLSNLLTGSVNDMYDVIQHHVAGRFDVITSGDIPPNPSEMLGSKHMKSLMDVLSKIYDYIIIDLPPVTAVPDPLVVTKLIEGVILVVRHEHAEKAAVQETMRLLSVANTNILGFVYNGNNNNSGSYSKKYYRKNKYKRYYSRGYGDSYGKTDTKGK